MQLSSCCGTGNIDLILQDVWKHPPRTAFLCPMYHCWEAILCRNSWWGLGTVRNSSILCSSRIVSHRSSLQFQGDPHLQSDFRSDVRMRCNTSLFWNISPLCEIPEYTGLARSLLASNKNLESCVVRIKPSLHQGESLLRKQSPRNMVGRFRQLVAFQVEPFMYQVVC